MEIVEGHITRQSISIDLHEGKLKVYHISEAKLRLFRDGGTLIGRMNDWAYTLLTCSISFFIAWLTTNLEFAKYILASLTIICLGASIFLFVTNKSRKNNLSELYEEVVSGNI